MLSIYIICPKCAFLSQKHRTADENKDFSTNRPSGALTPAEEISPVHQPPSIPSLNSITRLHTPQTPPAIRCHCSHPTVSSFPFPIPPFSPSVPPIPPRLPNGTIPIPPPGWIPTPGQHTGIPIPPPPIPPPHSTPPPPAFLGPPLPLIVLPSIPPPMHRFPLPRQHSGALDKKNPPRHVSTTLPFPQPTWPAPPFPRFNPYVPPPDYPLVRENPPKVTVDKVLEVTMDELKLIIKKDITRRMIEGIAFKAFEDWWECHEKKTKVSSHILYYYIKCRLKSHE